MFAGHLCLSIDFIPMFGEHKWLSSFTKCTFFAAHLSLLKGPIFVPLFAGHLHLQTRTHCYQVCPCSPYSQDIWWKSTLYFHAHPFRGIFFRGHLCKFVLPVIGILMVSNHSVYVALLWIISGSQIFIFNVVGGGYSGTSSSQYRNLPPPQPLTYLLVALASRNCISPFFLLQ